MKWQGRWDQMKGAVKEEWGVLTDDDVTEIDGRREQLVGRLKEKTGKALDEIERQVKAFEARFSRKREDGTGEPR